MNFLTQEEKKKKKTEEFIYHRKEKKRKHFLVRFQFSSSPVNDKVDMFYIHNSITTSNKHFR